MTPAPAPSGEAARIFGDRLDVATQYADLLAGEATLRGLIGPAETPRLWSRHLLNCAVLGELVDHGVQVVDIGAGAGLPGIPLAIARPDLSVVLVEPLLRRATWLEDVVSRLDLTSVQVIRARAEDLHGTLRSPVATARAVAPIDRLARWCLPLLEPRGQLLAIKGRTAQSELDEAGPALHRLGAVSAEVLEIGVGTLADPTSVIRVRVGSSDGADRHQGASGAARTGSRRTSRARPNRSARRRTEGGGT
ncbi:MAG: 16S rRNA (guanine(527)-N(7))-methyltransferase RsmG [Actinomycetales bacterium]